MIHVGRQNCLYYIGFIGIPDGDLYTNPWELDGDWFRDSKVYTYGADMLMLHGFYRHTHDVIIHVGDRTVHITLVL